MVLLGWVHRVRDLGGVTFIDIRDRAGVSQVVVRENDTLMPIAKKLRSEFVIGVSGVVQRRSEDTVNPKLATGEVEVLAREIRILNEAKTPPFQIAEDGPVSEDVRLRLHRGLRFDWTSLAERVCVGRGDAVARLSLGPEVRASVGSRARRVLLQTGGGKDVPASDRRDDPR